VAKAAINFQQFAQETQMERSKKLSRFTFFPERYESLAQRSELSACFISLEI